MHPRPSGKLIALTLALLCPLIVMAAGAGEPGSESLTHSMANLMVQLALAFLAAWGLGTLTEKLGQPAVLGELLAGVLIGPYLLGQLALPGFPHGVFPEAGAFPISPELYGFASLAAVILLFSVGLETDLESLQRYLLAGSTVGVAGVVGSFVAGDLVIVAFGQVLLPGQAVGVMHPAALFTGVVSAATSVGISARILSETRQIQSPEGVTILSGAVIDDILGIILLAVVLGIAESGQAEAGPILRIGLKAFLAWSCATALGLYLAPQAERCLKRMGNNGTVMHLSLAVALLLAGLLEKAGLAMIIGAYIVGLCISKTDLNIRIQDKLHNLERFFVPLFFCIMGMLVKVTAFADLHLLLIGAVLLLAGMLAKFLACGLATLPFGFNCLGAARVGMGMVPRGEVTLIVAGVGYSAGVLNDQIFSLAIMLAIGSALATPPILGRLLRLERSGLIRQPLLASPRRELVFPLPEADTVAFVLHRVERVFEQDGWIVTRRDHPHSEYHLAKDGGVIIIRPGHDRLTIDCPEASVLFVETLFYEEMTELERLMRSLQTLTGISAIGRRIFTDSLLSADGDGASLQQYLDTAAILPRLRATDKAGVLRELLRAQISAGHLPSSAEGAVLAELQAREDQVSTGMQDGIALPHTHSAWVSTLHCSIGLAPEGVAFNSLDGQPAQIVVLTLSPPDAHPTYLHFMSQLTSRLLDPARRERLLRSSDAAEIRRILAQG